MWIQTTSGVWRYETKSVTSQELTGSMVPKDLFKTNEKDNAATVYVPVQTLDDGYREHRLFKHVTPKIDQLEGSSIPGSKLELPDKAGFWVEAWFKKDSAVRDFFPNLALVELASSSETASMGDTRRGPKDFVNNFNKVGNAYVLDGVRVPQGQRVLIKDQWFEDLETYSFSRVPGKPSRLLITPALNPRHPKAPAQSLPSFGVAVFENFTNDNYAHFFDAENKLVKRVRIKDATVVNNTVELELYDYVPAALRVADFVDGDWMRTEQYASNNVYKYVGSRLDVEPDLDTPESRYHYTVWVQNGETHDNGQFFLERNGATAIAAHLADGKPLSTLSPVANVGYYPTEQEPRTFSVGSAHLIEHTLSYNIAPVLQEGSTTVVANPQPKVRFATLDYGLATRSGYQLGYQPLLVDTNDFNRLMYDGGNHAMWRYLELRFRKPKTPPTFDIARLTSYIYHANEFELVSVSPENFIFDATTIDFPGQLFIQPGDLVQISAINTATGKAIFDEAFCAYESLGGNGQVTSYAVTPSIDPAILTELLATKPDDQKPPVQVSAVEITCTVLSRYSSLGGLIANFNRSPAGKFYQLGPGPPTSTQLYLIDTTTRDNRYERRDITFSSGSSIEDIQEAQYHMLPQVNGTDGYDPIYGPAYDLRALFNQATPASVLFGVDYRIQSAAIKAYNYENTDIASPTSFGITQNGYVSFGEAYITDPSFDANSALSIFAGMSINIVTPSASVTKNVASANIESVEHLGKTYKKYVLRLSRPGDISSVIPASMTEVTIEIVGGSPATTFGSVVRVFEEHTDQGSSYKLPQRGYAYMLAKDSSRNVAKILSGMLFSDEERDMRVLMHIEADSSTRDPRLAFRPVEAMRLGVEHKVTVGTILEQGSDWVLVGDELILTPKSSKSRRIRFVDGLDETKIRNKVDGQGQYAWILDDDVVVVGAVVGCTGKNGTGDLIWYTGEWRAGNWEDGLWYSGVWRAGRWKQGKWYSYQVTVTPSTVSVNTSSQQNRFSVWRGGTWMAGQWNGGEWRNGTWVAGFFNFGEWTRGTWNNGTWNGGEWHNGTWLAGTWNGGNFNAGKWFGGTWNNGSNQESIFGSAAQVLANDESKRAYWFGGTWRGGTWNSGPSSADNRASVWFGGLWEGGTWNGGTFIMGTWNNGTWNNGVWAGGYRVRTSAGHISPITENVNTSTKTITLQVDEYNAALSINNTRHYLTPANSVSLLATPGPNPSYGDRQMIGAIIANNRYNDQVYSPKPITAVTNSTITIIVPSAPLGALEWSQYNAATGSVDGGPFVVPLWNGGTWNGGVWRNGIWSQGTWNKGLWLDGLWLNGVWSQTGPQPRVTTRPNRFSEILTASLLA